MFANIFEGFSEDLMEEIIRTFDQMRVWRPFKLLQEIKNDEGLVHFETC